MTTKEFERLSRKVIVGFVRELEQHECNGVEVLRLVAILSGFIVCKIVYDSKASLSAVRRLFVRGFYNAASRESYKAYKVMREKLENDE